MTIVGKNEVYNWEILRLTFRRSDLSLVGPFLVCRDEWVPEAPPPPPQSSLLIHPCPSLMLWRIGCLSHSVLPSPSHGCSPEWSLCFHDEPLETVQNTLRDCEAEQWSTHFMSIRSTMPACAEQSVALLRAHFAHRQILPSGAGLMSAEEVAAAYDRLATQLSHEQHGVTLPSLEGLRRAGTELEALTRLLSELRPVDVPRLLSLFAATRQASEDMRGRDAVLLLGPTGSGKSTLIHYLGGSGLRRRMHGPIEHPEPIPNGAALAGITTHYLSRCETAHVRAVEVHPDGVEDAVVLCDTPGADTPGAPEQAIAGGVAIARAVRGCRSVKPLVVIHAELLEGPWEGVAQVVVPMASALCPCTCPPFTRGIAVTLSHVGLFGVHVFFSSPLPPTPPFFNSPSGRLLGVSCNIPRACHNGTWLANWPELIFSIRVHSATCKKVSVFAGSESIHY